MINRNIIWIESYTKTCCIRRHEYQKEKGICVTTSVNVKGIYTVSCFWRRLHISAKARGFNAEKNQCCMDNHGNILSLSSSKINLPVSSSRFLELDHTFFFIIYTNQFFLILGFNCIVIRISTIERICAGNKY